MKEVVKAVIYKGDKFLLQLRDTNPAISYPNTWSLFGGEVDEGEDFDEALIRELEEELSWSPDEVVFLNKSKNNKVNCNITYYLVHCTLPEKSLVLGEGQAMSWFTFEEISGLCNIPEGVAAVINKASRYIKSV